MAFEFVSGFGLGIAVAAPIGPMAMLCIGRSMRGGAFEGSVTGLGAATVHAFFGAIAAHGLDAVYRGKLATIVPYLSLFAAMMLFWFAIRALRLRPTLYTTAKPRRSLISAYLTACLLGLSNPATLILFASSAPAFLQPGADASGNLLFTAGVFIGSCTWWQGLSFVFGTLSKGLGAPMITLINRVAAVALVALGASLLASHAACYLQLLGQVSLADSMGFAGAAMTLLAFAQTQMLRMRIAAIVANVFFIGFGFLAAAHPVLALHAVLLPLNVHRLVAYLPPGGFPLFQTIRRLRGSLS